MRLRARVTVWETLDLDLQPREVRSSTHSITEAILSRTTFAFSTVMSREDTNSIMQTFSTSQYAMPRLGAIKSIEMRKHFRLRVLRAITYFKTHRLCHPTPLSFKITGFMGTDILRPSPPDLSLVCTNLALQARARPHTIGATKAWPICRIIERISSVKGLSKLQANSKGSILLASRTTSL